ncbi:hypothetical protein GA0074704_0563 [Micromonospora siamensis]|uniref:Uncharacterized protein n=1 Tax=Micromonospora siamensis TaxID=299152 RepID=A0A1C5GVE5_9ACTN|nr:hypothetical protein GA0074704_0563 [Micromonospora siamensis]
MDSATPSSPLNVDGLQTEPAPFHVKPVPINGNFADRRFVCRPSGPATHGLRLIGYV